jgi:hypothetical protein
MRGEGANVTDECGALTGCCEGAVDRKKTYCLHEPRFGGYR